MRKRIKRKLILKDCYYSDEDDEEEFYEDEEDEGGDLEQGSAEGAETYGPAFQPSFFGLYKADGSPYLRHPVAIRMGFHPERNKYHTPTLEEGYEIPSQASVVGWVYD